MTPVLDDAATMAGFVAFGGLLLWLSVQDVKTGLLPDRFVFALAGMGALLVLSGKLSPPLSALGGAGLGGGLLFAVRRLSRGGMGGGDVKLAAALGIWTGVSGILPALFLAFFLGSLWGLVLLAQGRGRRARLPFGPCLAVGGAVGTLYGEAIASWYEAFL